MRHLVCFILLFFSVGFVAGCGPNTNVRQLDTTTEPVADPDAFTESEDPDLSAGD